MDKFLVIFLTVYCSSCIEKHESNSYSEEKEDSISLESTLLVNVTDMEKLANEETIEFYWEDSIHESESWDIETQEGDLFDTATIELNNLNLPIVENGSLIDILTIGEFHEDEVSQSAIDKSWIGLFVNGDTSYLKNANLILTRVSDSVIDNAGEKTGWKVSTDNEDKCIILISGIGLHEGKIVSFNIDPKDPKPEDTLSFNFDSEITELHVTGTVEKYQEQFQFITNYKMKIIRDSIGQVIVAKPNFDEESINIIWAGDIDRDGKLDLIIDTSRHYNIMEPSLFLSSKANNGELLKCVAIHRSLGC